MSFLLHGVEHGITILSLDFGGTIGGHFILCVYITIFEISVVNFKNCM